MELFQVYGTGEPGGKASNLERYADVLDKLGMKIVPGSMILSDVFFAVLEYFGISQDESSVKPFMDKSSPAVCREINISILSTMEIGKPYAIRSSALAESGGTGIYKTNFFVPTGNQEMDLETLWRKEAEVYESEFTADARAWRKRFDRPIGMAILIEQVPGFELDGLWVTPLSGVAYTSYQGLPILRVTLGLGTTAVDGHGLVFREIPDHVLSFHRALWDIEEGEAIEIATGQLKPFRTHREEFYGHLNYGAFRRLNDNLNRLKVEAGEDLSLEYVITREGDIIVTQCDPYIDRLPGSEDITVNPDEYFLLADGADVLHSGQASGQGIICVETWNNDAASMLEYLNERLNNYLLIVPQDAFSLLAGLKMDRDGNSGVRIGFCHFSNAAAVIERQRKVSGREKQVLAMSGVSVADHTGGLGASHFEQVCGQSNILFLGAVFDDDPLYMMDAGVHHEGGIRAWDQKYLVVVDGVKKVGHAYVSKEPLVTNRDYSPRQIQDMSFALREVANKLCDQKNKLSDSFYIVHYAIGDNDDPLVFDPYALEPTILEECGGLDKFRTHLDQVLENLHLLFEFDGDPLDIREYLEQLKQKIATS